MFQGFGRKPESRLRRYRSFLSNALPGALTFAQCGLDLRVVEVGHRAQSERDGIGELREAYDHDGLENLLFGESVGSQGLDVVRRRSWRAAC